jgi:hypothetical protein
MTGRGVVHWPDDLYAEQPRSWCCHQPMSAATLASRVETGHGNCSVRLRPRGGRTILCRHRRDSRCREPIADRSGPPSGACAPAPTSSAAGTAAGLSARSCGDDDDIAGRPAEELAARLQQVAEGGNKRQMIAYLRRARLWLAEQRAGGAGEG